MNLEQIDRYCDLFEQRLKAGQACSIETFLKEHGLQPAESLMVELLRLQREYPECGGFTELSPASAETYIMEVLRQTPEPNETVGPLPPSLTGTAEWSLDRTVGHELQRRGTSITASLKAPIAVDPKSRTTLFIQSRSLKPPHASTQQPADFDLINLLGKGGMGLVFAARQGSLDRVVAIKMLKPDGAADPGSRNEFLSEACITGELEHPNIVPIYDLGTNAEGNLFYAMKRVQGTPWKDVLKETPLHENIEILMRVSDAIAFAHSKGIIHRDLKPENIMLGGFGEVLVMDWGLAVPTDVDRPIGGIRKVPTMGGTPAYMAPELVQGPFQLIGPASDVYLLGAMLYEITTGLRPHSGHNVRECLDHAARNVIQSTDKSGELIDIARQAMATHPTDRYPTVQAFQAAIREYQSHWESIALSTLAEEHLGKAHQSNDYQHYSRALFAFQQAIELWDGNAKAKSGLEETQLAYARCAQAKGDFDLGAGLLDLNIAGHSELHQEIVAAKVERDARKQRLRTYKRAGVALLAAFLAVVTLFAVLIYQAKLEADHNANIAKENERTAIAEGTRANRERDRANELKTRAEIGEADAKDKKQLAETNMILAQQNAREAIAAKKAQAYEAYVARIGAAAAKIEENAYDSARELLQNCIPKTADEEDHRHWEWGRMKYLCEQASRPFPVGVPLESVAYSVGPNGQIDRFVAGGGDGKAVIWKLDGTPPVPLDAQANLLHCLAFSPDGRIVAAGTAERSDNIKLFDPETGSLQRTLTDPAGNGHTRAVLSIEFSADGQRLLSSSEDGKAKIWDVAAGKVLCTLHGHRWWVWQARFCRNKNGGVETKIVTASNDGTAIVWIDETGEWVDEARITKTSLPPFLGHDGPVYAAAFLSDGKTIATAGHDQRVLLWNLDDLREFDYNRAIAAPLSEAAAVEVPYRSLIGHTAIVRSLDFSRDGQLLISGGHDNTIKIWNVDRAIPLKTLRGHGQWVRSCRLAPDGLSVLSASFDGTARLWDMDGYEEARVLRGKVLEGHDDAVLRAEFSADGTSIVTAGRDRTIKTWDPRTANELQTYREGHSFLAAKSAFSADGSLLATAAIDGTARIWDVRSGSQRHVFHNTGRSAVVALSPDGRLALTGGPEIQQDNQPLPMWSAKLWNVETGAIVHELRGHASHVTAAAISPDGKLLYTGDFNGRGMLWETESGQPLRPLAWHTAKIIAAAFSEDNQHLFTAAAERNVVRWDLPQGHVDESKLLIHPTDIVAMDVDRLGRYIVTSCQDNVARLWDFETGKLIREWVPRDESETKGIRKVSISMDGQFILDSHPDQRVVRIYESSTGEEMEFLGTTRDVGPFLKLSERSQLWTADFSPDGRQVVTVGGDQVRLWAIDRDALPFRRLQMDFSPHGVVASACFSTDGRSILSGSWDATAIIWDVKTGESRQKLAGQHAGAVNWAAFSPDPNSSLVLTASDDQTAILWDAQTAKFLRRYVGHAGPILCATFSSDGKRMLTASRDKTIRIWAIENGSEPIRVLSGHRADVLHAVFSHDGGRVISGSSDNTAIVWDVAKGEPEFVLVGHTAPVNSVAFSSEGDRAVTGSADFTAKFWDARAHSRGKELLTLAGHNREVASVAFSPDGRSVLTGSHDGTAILWTASDWRLSQAPLAP